jgi:asparagine synthase (glutamine-hydrolysing)
MTYADYAYIKALTRHLDVMPIEDYIAELMQGCTYRSDFYKLMYFNFMHSLPDDYLVKVDRMSMANSLETRVPFLDPRLIEYMAGVDKSVKMQGWERKSVLRAAFGHRLPPALLKAPKKGFGIPLREWFKDDSFRDSIGRLTASDIFGLDRSVVKTIADENLLGKADHGNFLWALFSLNHLNPTPAKP